jgi:hypothetical protein
MRPEHDAEGVSSKLLASVNSSRFMNEKKKKQCSRIIINIPEKMVVYY